LAPPPPGTITSQPLPTTNRIPDMKITIYSWSTKKFTAQRYYPAGDATAVRTETGLSWMVDDHHGTASMTVDATTQAVTHRYTKPFGENRGPTPSSWPDDKGFLGKPADTDTGLTHIGAREYDPTLGRFLSVDPVLAPDDHESLNGYAYANNTPVTKSDPTGLRPIGNCEVRSCSDGNGGTYRDYLTPGRDGGWVYHSTQKYTQTFQYQKAGGGTGSGTMTVTVRTDGGVSTAKVVFKKGPDPKPEKKEQVFHGWAMGTNPNYDPTVSDNIDRGKLATWQKVVVGAIAAVAVVVVAAPVAVAVGEGCLATAPVCAAEIAEIATGGASGGSLTAGGAAAAVGVGGYSAARSTTLGGKYFTPETGLKVLINPGGGRTNCRACVISLDQMMASGARSNAIPTLERGSHTVIEKFYGKKFRNRSFSNIVSDMQKAGSGARGIVWGADPDGGHVFNVVNIDGRVTFLDGQSGNASHAPTWDSYQWIRTN
ncbi:RHS repeat-associated core domain-containing protein, partial [Streptomyces sp. NPDC018964]|uniref:RHS repeat-associated core domain-containing protein n=1 Tax=Streptomyces sp. NPDC018964 TaxID=3365058 RepID=UPI0037982AAC